MTVASTAKRRRRQMVIDKRYKKKDLSVASRRDQAKVEAAKARATRSKGK